MSRLPYRSNLSIAHRLITEIVTYSCTGSGSIRGDAVGPLLTYQPEVIMCPGAPVITSEQGARWSITRTVYAAPKTSTVVARLLRFGVGATESWRILAKVLIGRCESTERHP